MTCISYVTGVYHTHVHVANYLNIIIFKVLAIISYMYTDVRLNQVSNNFIRICSNTSSMCTQHAAHHAHALYVRRCTMKTQRLRKARRPWIIPTYNRLHPCHPSCRSICHTLVTCALWPADNNSAAACVRHTSSARSIQKISILKRDGHTYIHTDTK